MPVSKELVEATNNLPRFPSEVASGDHNRYKEYEMDEGVCYSWNLLTTPSISVHKWFCSEGTKFPIHTHLQKEWIFIYSGQMHIDIDGKNNIILEQSLSYHEVNRPHKAYFPEDTWFITVMIPKAEEYPNGQ